MEYTPYIWKPEDIQRFWDFYSSSSIPYWGETYGKSFLRCFKDIVCRSKFILDYGAGSGGLIHHILSIKSYMKSKELVYAYEYSPQSASQLDIKFSSYDKFHCFSNLDMLQASMSRMALKPDLIFCTEVIEHLYDEQLNTLLNHLRSLLSTNGRILFSTPNCEVLLESSLPVPGTSFYFHKWQHVRSWSASSFSSYLQPFGLLVDEYYETNLSLHVPFPKGLYRTVRNMIQPCSPNLLMSVKLI